MKKLDRAVIKRELVELTGDFKKAIVLNQMIYWAERSKDADRFLRDELKRAEMAMGKAEMDYAQKLEGVDLMTHGWIYKSAEELSEETMMGVSKSTMGRYLNELVKNGWLDKRKNPKWKGDNTFQYRVNLLKIQRDLLEIGYSLEGYSIDISLIQNDTTKSNYETSEFEDETGSFKMKQAISKSNRQFQNETTLPETTTETTTEITTENTTTTNESDVAEIIEFWDTNGFGINNIHAKQSLLLYLNDGSFDEPKEMILEAMKIACGNGKTFGRFVEGILKRWAKQNIRCVEDISRHRFDEYSNQAKYPGGEDVVPEWFEDRHKRDGSQTSERNQEIIVDVDELLIDMKKMIKQAKAQGKAGATHVK